MQRRPCEDTEGGHLQDRRSFQRNRPADTWISCVRECEVVNRGGRPPGLRLFVKAAFTACTARWSELGARVHFFVSMHLLEPLNAEAGHGRLGPRCPGADGLARLHASLFKDFPFAWKLHPDEWKEGSGGFVVHVGLEEHTVLKGRAGLSSTAGHLQGGLEEGCSPRCTGLAPDATSPSSDY